MFQFRFHGRGGQGVVTAAEMLSVAAFSEGKHAQAFPSFGSERMGAPVMSFCRISDQEIRLRDPVYDPDVLMIQDPTLLHNTGLFDGLKDDGYVLINSTHDLSTLGIDTIVHRLPKGHILTIPATEIALRHVKKPVPNAVMLGGLVALTGIIRLESVLTAINEAFSGQIAERNITAAKEAYDLILAQKNNMIESKEKEAMAC